MDTVYIHLMVIIIDGLYKYCTFTALFFCYPESLTLKVFCCTF